MKYRTMRFIGGEENVSLLGLGCMRFPLKEDGTIDEVQAEAMIERAINAGINYIDTAYPYHKGESEPFLGRALKKYPRNSFYLATKLPVWLVNSVEDAERLFKEQLSRLQTKYIDYYLLHALDAGRWEKLVKEGIIQWAEEKKASGQIRHLGFSFHDTYPVFRKILTYRQWDFCQIQYNYIDTQIQAGDKGYELAAKMGVPMVIMEPVKGGRLAELPEEVEEVLKEADPDRSVASYALRWVGSHENVKVILSGMSSMEQLEDNLETFGKFQPLTELEEEAVEKAADLIRSRMKNGCTSCRYCMPCPFGVNIPEMFSIWNNCAMFDEAEKAKKAYGEQKKQNASADLCKKCGACEKVCPQGLSIRADLEKVAKELNTEEA